MNAAANRRILDRTATSVPAGVAAAIVVGPVTLLTIAECLFRDLHRFVLSQSSGISGYLIWMPVGLTVLLVGTISMISFRFGRDGYLSLAAGYAVGAIAVTHSRGSHIWPGLFDFSTLSGRPLLAATGLSILLGALGALIFRRRPSLRTTALTTIILAGVAVSWTWVHYLTDGGPYSAFVYSRHIAMSIALALLTTTYLATREDFE